MFTVSISCLIRLLTPFEQSLQVVPDGAVH